MQTFDKGQFWTTDKVLLMKPYCFILYTSYSTTTKVIRFINGALSMVVISFYIHVLISLLFATQGDITSKNKQTYFVVCFIFESLDWYFWLLRRGKSSYFVANSLIDYFTLLTWKKIVLLNLKLKTGSK